MSALPVARTASPKARSTNALRPLAITVHLLAAGTALTSLPALAQQASPTQATELAPLTVTGQGERRTTTEGSEA